MSERVPSDQIENIVGVDRHPVEHWGRADSDAEMVYILHSEVCLGNTPDLRDCPYSLALDRGIDPAQWVMDVPVRVMVQFGQLVPYGWDMP